MASENIKVCVRVRPLNDRESQSGSAWIVDGESTIRHQSVSHALFTFDHVFDQQATTEMVYEKQGAQIVQSVMEGINGKII
jgi:hypothetical protein